MKRNIEDILRDKEVTRLPNESLLGISYECWEVDPPVYADQVETLLENGYMVSMLSGGKINIEFELVPSPEQLRENKRFWNDLNEAIES